MMGRQLHDSKTDTQHFSRPSVDEVLGLLREILSPVYSDVLLERIECLEAEVKRLEADIERINRRIGASSR